MSNRRCPSCEHTAAFHQPEGCWFAVVDARPNRNIGCACARPFGVAARRAATARKPTAKRKPATR